MCRFLFHSNVNEIDFEWSEDIWHSLLETFESLTHTNDTFVFLDDGDIEKGSLGPWNRLPLANSFLTGSRCPDRREAGWFPRNWRIDPLGNEHVSDTLTFADGNLVGGCDWLNIEGGLCWFGFLWSGGTGSCDWRSSSDASLIIPIWTAFFDVWAGVHDERLPSDAFDQFSCGPEGAVNYGFVVDACGRRFRYRDRSGRR